MSVRSRETLSRSARSGKRNLGSLVTTRFLRRELIHDSGSLPFLSVADMVTYGPLGVEFTPCRNRFLGFSSIIGRRPEGDRCT